ncbi:hypothetical protein BGX38DRAFT_1258130 [Terfezia claveryi]|nr:hypothetical protein BGX38DRAFT_1258130 [Terfezia claveryi]
MSKAQTALKSFIASRNGFRPTSIPQNTDTPSTGNLYVCFSCQVKQQQRRRIYTPSSKPAQAQSPGVKVAWTPSKEGTSPSELQFTAKERAMHATLRQRSLGPNSMATTSTSTTSSSSSPTTSTGRLPPRLKALVTSRLSNYYQTRYESDVSSRDTLLKSNKLVNMPELRYNINLWCALLAFRRRVHGDKGVVDIFHGMKLRNVPLPSTGVNADRMWGIILETAFRLKDFLEEVLSSVVGKRAWARKGEGAAWRREECWPQFYEKIIGYYILRKPAQACMFHDKLVWAGCAPKDWGEFMVNICRNISKLGYSPHRRAALHRLRGIFTSVKVGGVYEKLIPFLVKHVTVTEAFKWHKQCLAQGDKPRDSSPADGIFDYLGTAGIMGEIRDFVEAFLGNGVSIAESSLVALVRGRWKKDDVLVMLVQMVNKGKIEKGVFGDGFWEVVLRDKLLEGGTLIGLMKVCGVQVVGEKGIRTLVRRFKDVGEVNGFVEKLRMHGIEVPEEKLLRAQEELDTYGVRPIELANPQRQLDKEHYDKLLATHLTQRNLPSALNTLKDMLAYTIPIRPATLRFLLRSILRPRRRGHAPKTLPPQQVSKDDLALAINTLLSCLRGGMFVPPSLWQEIFRRLGMEYQLADLERLAVYLVEWYHPLRGQNMLKRFASAFVVTPEKERAFYTPRVRPLFWDEKGGRWAWLTANRRGNRESLLRRLFPRSFMAAVVEWGVLGVFRRRAGILKGLPGIPEQGFSGGEVDITWGLRLALHLHRSGAFLDTRTLLRALRVRARALYGQRPDSRRSPHNLSTRACLLPWWPTLEKFVEKVNKDYAVLVGGGRELFVSRNWADMEDGEERRRVLERVVIGIAGEEAVGRRERRRWKGRGVEVGVGGRDRWGRWRLSDNERRRRARVEREREGNPYI